MADRRKKGTGTLIERKDGRWEGRAVVGYDDNGKAIKKSVISRSKSDCQKKLKELIKQSYCTTGKLPGQAKPSMLFGEWMDMWYQNYCKNSVRESTQSGYENRIYKHIIPEIGDIPLDCLAQNDLQEFYLRLKLGGRLKLVDQKGKGLSDRMVRACHTSCRSALEKAVNEGLIQINPAIGCKLPPKKAREMQVLSHDEMQRFLIQAKEEGFYEMAVLELSTGMRRGEICALQWDDLDLKTGELRICRQVYRADGQLTVSQPKTRTSLRTVILPPVVLSILKERKEHSGSKWIFPSPKDDAAPCSPDAIRKKLKRILEHAECRTVRFHDLRHTFATTALEHGMDVKTLSAIIGHVNSATTLNIYSHVTDQMRIQAAEKIDAGIGGCEAREADLSRLPSGEGNRPAPKAFTPYQGSRRKPGTGCLHQINDHLWEGKYAPRGPDGKRIHKNVYAATKEECEAKLQAMIAETKAEIRKQKP